MAAKLLQTLADDNPDLQKQIGCMTGIFQLFDRHHMVSGRRYGHKRLLPGNPQFDAVGLDRETTDMYLQQTPDEVSLYKIVNEKQRFSTESSRASFSSTCSSSLSSLECGRTVQPESSSFDRITFPEAPSRDHVANQSGMSPNLGRKSMDLRDVVKDSMYREAQGLSVKMMGRVEATGFDGKYKGSPKQLKLPKPTEGSYKDGFEGKHRVPLELKESMKVLAKLREAPWYFNEVREHPRSSLYELKEGISPLMSKDVPRLSYDRRELNQLSFESRETIKSTPKMKELPRLSLDSRDGSMLSSSSHQKTNLLRSASRRSAQSNEDVHDPPESSESQMRRPPSVVAKLMGLEALPDSASAKYVVKSQSSNQSDSCSRPLKAIGGSRPIRSSVKESESPRWKNHDAVMKPISRFPNEPAPWKQMEGNRNSQKQPLKPVKVQQKPTESHPSVYGEIEKRLKDLEFKQSGKDLRALKQILEAIQAKGLLETRKEEQASNFGSLRNPAGKARTLSQNSRLERQQNLQSGHTTAPTAGKFENLRSFESPIVIMKPAKLVEKYGFNSSSMIPMGALSSLHKIHNGGSGDSKNLSTASRQTKDQSTKISRRDSTNPADKKAGSRSVKPTPSSSRSQLVSRENSVSSAKTSCSVSPRLQQKKLELERRSRPPTPPSDPNKPRKLSNRQISDASSPSGRQRHKSSNLNSSDDQLSEVSNESRTPSCQGDDISVHSDSSIVFESKIDGEFAGIDLPAVAKCGQCPSPSMCSETDLMQKELTPVVDEDEAMTELGSAATEYHSPVSVLDSSVHTEDASTPIKQMPASFRGDGAYESDYSGNQDPWKPTESLEANGSGAVLTSEINRKKLQNVEQLVQKLRRLNSSHDEKRTDYIASLCENTKPDHRYISEILLASGLLLRDLGSSMTAFQLHPSGHPINPELFFVLEQTKSRTLLKEEYSCGKEEKIHRKLIFDAVNEILIGKLTCLGVLCDPCSKSEKLVRKALTAQKLLKELCAEIDHLDAKKPYRNLEEEDDALKSILAEDVLHRSESWTEFNSETSAIVLDIERLIFKDLVNEIVIGGTGSSLVRPGRRRELFTN